MTVFVTDTQRDRQASECAGKKEMILSKWCFISVINPASQEDEEGLSLSPATIVRNKDTLMGPIRAKYQISSLRMILPSRTGGLLNLWPQSYTPSCSTYWLIRKHLHTHPKYMLIREHFFLPQTVTRPPFHSSSYCNAVCLCLLAQCSEYERNSRKLIWNARKWDVRKTQWDWTLLSEWAVTGSEDFEIFPLCTLWRPMHTNGIIKQIIQALSHIWSCKT